MPVRTLDGLLVEQGLDRVDFIKLDVQRAETEVLRGARATLESNRDVSILFEETADPAGSASVRFLREFGFDIRRLDEFNFVADRSK